MISQKVKKFSCPDLSNLTKNHKMKNSSETMDIPSKSSKQHHDKVLTFIGLIGARYLTYSIIVQILYVWTCQVWRKIKICQTCKKPSILLSKVVTWWSTGYDTGRVDLKCSWSLDLPFRDFLKSKKKFACPDLSNLTKNWKPSNILKSMAIPSKSSKHHLDKVLTFIRVIGAG